MGRGDSLSSPGPASLCARQTAEPVVRYGHTAMALHWLMAVLLLAQIAIGLTMVELPKRTPEVATFYNLHKSLGLVALILIAFRLWWRTRVPAPPATGLHTSDLQEAAARWSHRLLVGLMLLLPLAGLIGSAFGKYPVRFFGYALPLPGWESEPIQALFRQTHAALAWLLCALIALHVSAVIYHLAVSRKPVLQRMLPRIQDFWRGQD